MREVHGLKSRSLHSAMDDKAVHRSGRDDTEGEGMDDRAGRDDTREGDGRIGLFVVWLFVVFVVRVEVEVKIVEVGGDWKRRRNE